jgi:hypothetical protein
MAFLCSDFSGSIDSRSIPACQHRKIIIPLELECPLAGTLKNDPEGFRVWRIVPSRSAEDFPTENLPAVNCASALGLALALGLF